MNRLPPTAITRSCHRMHTKFSGSFAKNCVKHNLTSDIFPLNTANSIGTRNKEKYRVTHANTDRLEDLAVHYSLRLLNAKKWMMTNPKLLRLGFDTYQDQKDQSNL